MVGLGQGHYLEPEECFHELHKNIVIAALCLQVLKYIVRRIQIIVASVDWLFATSSGSTLFSNSAAFSSGYLRVNPIPSCNLKIASATLWNMIKQIMTMQYNTLKRNRNDTLFQWKIHGVLFKVIDGENEPLSFQAMLMSSTK